MKLFLYYVGKPRDQHANALAADYIARANRFAPSLMAEVRPDRTDLRAKHPSAKRILLDPLGRSFDSPKFADLFARAEMAGQDLVFAIGGHDGLPQAWRDQADLLVSLSPLTLPHELARAVLAEQIYRAFTMLRGHPYPR
jgi:23S rRNA (pseudouridine1915-N3)-methyltransferase